jgi:hypothetical protein
MESLCACFEVSISFISSAFKHVPLLRWLRSKQERTLSEAEGHAVLQSIQLLLNSQFVVAKSNMKW